MHVQRPSQKQYATSLAYVLTKLKFLNIYFQQCWVPRVVNIPGRVYIKPGKS